MEKDIFKEEQDHLTETYRILQGMKEGLDSDILDLKQKASEEKNDIRDYISFDLADDEAKFEAMGEIETWNRYIDSYNISSNLLHSKLKNVNKLLEAPYFARVTLQFDPDEEPEDYYIGNAQLAKEGSLEPLILDWRTPVAETYYNQENGHTSYEVNGQKIEVELKLRRQFDISQDKLNAYFDTLVAIEDSLLLKSLSRQHSDKMQAITATIQKEQNAVIRHKDVPVLLVNGIAGSGKTSVLLQRIAYLFYRQRETLRPDHVYLLTLNPVFRQYIDNVLPDMGERNPNIYTWQEFLSSVGVPFRDKEKDRTKASDLRRIDEMLPKLKIKSDYFKPVYQKDRQIFSSKAISTILRNEFHIPMGVHLMKVAEDELEERAKNILRRTRRNTDGDSDVSEMERQKSREELGRKDENSIQNNLGGAIKAIHHFDWIDYAAIGKKLLGREYLSAGEWFYIKMAMTGACDLNARYVMIDEVQDYTEAQLMILRRYFPNAKFMLLGDEFQSIREETATFSQIKKSFESDGTPVLELPLMTSYRSSPEITELFTGLLPEEQRGKTSSVQRAGEKPEIHSCLEFEEYEAALREAVRVASEKEETTAIVCMNRKSIRKVQDVLTLEDSTGENIPPVIRASESLPKQGVFLIELSMAKGLEFDHVIVPDADRARYPDDKLSRHRLYTAISRATQHLTVLSDGRMTSLIPAQDR